MKHYNLSELQQMPTLSVGQADNLKVDTGTERLWLSRCTVADGEPYNNKVTIEKLINGVWTEVQTYPATDDCGYQPKTGARCSCRPGQQRDNCPTCEGTGWVVDFAAIRARRMSA